MVELVNLLNSVIIFLSQTTFAEIVMFPTQIRDCDSHSPALLNLFLYSNASICSTIAFPPLGNSDHFVPVSIDFPSYSQRHAPFHRIAYDYSRTDCDGFRDYLRCSMGMDISLIESIRS